MLRGLKSFQDNLRSTKTMKDAVQHAIINVILVTCNSYVFFYEFMKYI